MNCLPKEPVPPVTKIAWPFRSAAGSRNWRTCSTSPWTRAPDRKESHGAGDRIGYRRLVLSSRTRERQFKGLAAVQRPESHGGGLVAAGGVVGLSYGKIEDFSSVGP